MAFIIQKFAGSSFSFGIMWLHVNDKENINTVNHEWGHFAQMLIGGPAIFFGCFGLPSILNYYFGEHKNYTGTLREKMYYSKIWERTADYLGGVNRNNYYDFWYNRLLGRGDLS